MSKNVVVRFELVDFLPTSNAVTMPNMFGWAVPTGNLMAMLVTIFWLVKNKPILDFFQHAGRVHFPSEGIKSLGWTLRFSN